MTPIGANSKNLREGHKVILRCNEPSGFELVAEATVDSDFEEGDTSVVLQIDKIESKGVHCAVKEGNLIHASPFSVYPVEEVGTD